MAHENEKYTLNIINSSSTKDLHAFGFDSDYYYLYIFCFCVNYCCCVVLALPQRLSINTMEMMR